MIKLYLFFFFVFFEYSSLVAQQTPIPVKEIDTSQLKAVKARQKKGRFDAIGEVVSLRTDILLEAKKTQVGTWTNFEIVFRASNASGLNFYFNNVSLPTGSRFNISGNYKEQVLAIESKGKFATGFIYGESAIMQISIPTSKLQTAVINLEGMGVTTQRILPETIRKDFGNATACNINLRCEEGDLWQGIGRSVVRILVRNENLVGWCTGVLVNNTNEDFSPYILTAQHCGLNEITGNIVPQSNFDQWVFYFNYEVSDCTGNFLAIDVPLNIMAGADLIAHSDDEGGDFGSDFLLLELKSAIPPNFNPVFAGWSNEEFLSPAGTSIHHPQGDVKKISTYDTLITSSQFSRESSIRNTHWRVLWTDTDNGFGITEAGSSGAPLFNNAGQIIGNLTGGISSCSNTDGFDLYGKVSYHWFSNGSEQERQLAPWLDPLGLDVLTLRSIDLSGNLVTGKTCQKLGQKFNPQIYPNPSQGVFSISLPASSSNNNTTLYVFDRTGKQVYEEKVGIFSQNFSLDISHLVQGLYFIEIGNNDFKYRHKIVIR